MSPVLYAHLQERRGGGIPGAHAEYHGFCFGQAPSPALAGVDEVMRGPQGFGDAATSRSTLKLRCIGSMGPCTGPELCPWQASSSQVGVPVN